MIFRYDSFSFKHAIQEIPEFRWCQAGCGSGQIHRGKGTIKETYNFFVIYSYNIIFFNIIFFLSDPIVICVKCGARSCYFHDAPWHENYSCEEYRKPPDVATKVLLSQSSSKTNICPGCDMYIEKISGCQHMTCKCSRKFNFV